MRTKNKEQRTTNPEHIAYGYRVLPYLSDTQEIGITHHGSRDVLNIDGYDITNKLIGTVDSDLGGCKDTDKSTSGLVLMLNGGRRSGYLALFSSINCFDWYS